MPTYPLIQSGHRLSIFLPGGSVPIPMILGIGLNYAKHAAEQGSKLPERPVMFAKNIAALTGGFGVIRVPKICQDGTLSATGVAVGPEGLQVDYEGELAIVIGPSPDPSLHCHNVAEKDAHKFILGYAVANDVSARWWQKSGSGGQFTRGKGFDTFCPLSDIAAASDVGDPNALRLVTKVNGEVRQDSTTADMIFGVYKLVAELSQGTTLLPGTVILTGTPEGVGMARKPQVFLKDGDVVEIEIERVGRICNRVEFE